jgi:tetratricopeptide (TPR) repeat protein
LAHHASLLLAVGRVDEANADLEKALRLKPNYSDAYALQSIIAVVQNDKDKALNLAQKAVEADPNSLEQSHKTTTGENNYALAA